MVRILDMDRIIKRILKQIEKDKKKGIKKVYWIVN